MDHVQYIFGYLMRREETLQRYQHSSILWPYHENFVVLCYSWLLIQSLLPDCTPPLVFSMKVNKKLLANDKKP